LRDDAIESKYDPEVRLLLLGPDDPCDQDVEELSNGLYERLRNMELAVGQQLLSGAQDPRVPEERRVLALEIVASAQILHLEEQLFRTILDSIASMSPEIRFGAVASATFLSKPRRREIRNALRPLAVRDLEEDEEVREAARAYLRFS
jgi:hypothetical protein